MFPSIMRAFITVILIFATIGIAINPILIAQQSSPRRTAQAWTLNEALAAVSTNPGDPYLQYVALQLGRREGKLDQVVEIITARRFSTSLIRGRGADVDLFNMFTGALAVQESLQLDTMRGGTSRVVATAEGATTAYSTPPQKQGPVPIDSLSGPTVKSHPWKEMLAGRKPQISALAMDVPDDFYFVEFSSLGKLLDASQAGDLWGTHLANQASQDAKSYMIVDRLKQQLALETHPELRSFYDQVVQHVAITGSDPFMREGSDVTMLFQFRNSLLFSAAMDRFLENAEKAHPDATRTPGEYLGVKYVQLSTPDHSLNVFSAYPGQGLHVRSNSLGAFRHVLEAVQGKTPDGSPARRLGETDEFAYIRTIMSQGAKEEDGLIYLSDSFIRRLVGPKLKITEMRRMICYNNLRMIGHAALMYRTEFGRAPSSLQELVRAKCAPGLFGEGVYKCPHGGHYTLSSDGMTAHCSVHGDVNLLTPDYDIALDKVGSDESEAYKAFVTDYNQYWRTYFDPIAIRLQITPQRFRLETIVLPLIDNSVYTDIAHVFGGATESLDALPVPSRNIFSLAVHIDKAQLIKTLEPNPTYSSRNKTDDSTTALAQSLGVKPTDLSDFLNKGLGNQIALHIYDAPQAFDFNFAQFMAEAMGMFGGHNSLGDPFFVYIGILIEAMNAPIYLSIPVQDKQIVDDFLNHLDRGLVAQTRTGRDFLDFGTDFYQLKQGDRGTRSYSLAFGPLKWRFFWARVGDGLYIASKPFVLDDLVQEDLHRSLADGPAPKMPQPVDDSVANGLIKVRAQNWQQVLPDFRLGWEENSRQACAANVSMLSGIARAQIVGSETETQNPETFSAEIQHQAEKLYGVHPFCPDGGKYQLSADKKSVTCTIHGSGREPKQLVAPVEDSDLGKLLNSFGGMTGALTFTNEGLRAVMTIDRK